MQKLEVVSKDKSMVGKSGGDILAEHLVRIKAEKAAERAKHKEDDLLRKRIDQLKERDKRVRDYKYAVLRMSYKFFEVGEINFSSLPIEAQKALFVKIEAIAKKRFLIGFSISGATELILLFLCCEIGFPYFTATILTILNLVISSNLYIEGNSPQVFLHKKYKSEAFPKLFNENKELTE